MKILVTNDDGIYAAGLWALAGELKKVGEVVVVAPDREQSAIGTAVTLHQPLRLTEIKPPLAGIKAYSVEGTPADSVILALGVLEEVGIVFSGINPGANLGADVIISGTIGAALQGYFHGLPSVALSVEVGEDMHYEVAARLGGLLASKIISNSLTQGILLNINLPNLPIDEIEGVKITRLARSGYNDRIQEGHDGKRKYYWIVRGEPRWNIGEGTDIQAIKEDKVSITPLQEKLNTHRETPFIEGLPDLLQELKKLR